MVRSFFAQHGALQCSIICTTLLGFVTPDGPTKLDCIACPQRRTLIAARSRRALTKLLIVHGRGRRQNSLDANVCPAVSDLSLHNGPSRSRREQEIPPQSAAQKEAEDVAVESDSRFRVRAQASSYGGCRAWKRRF